MITRLHRLLSWARTFAVTLGVSLMWTSSLCVGSAAAKPVTLRLQPYLGRLFTVETTVDGRPARLLLDTGGGLTMITPDFAARTGCRPHGGVTAFRMSGERVVTRKCLPMELRAAGYSRRLEPVVFDLMALLPKDVPPLDGVLSLDAFEGHRVKLDLAHRVLEVDGPPPIGWKGELRLAREAGGAGLTAFVTVAARLGELHLLLDSDNLAGVVVSPSAAEQLGLPPDAKSGRLPLQLKGLPASPTAFAVRDVVYDGALDADFFLTHVIWLDLGTPQIWYSPVPPVSVRRTQ